LLARAPKRFDDWGTSANSCQLQLKPSDWLELPNLITHPRSSKIYFSDVDWVVCNLCFAFIWIYKVSHRKDNIKLQFLPQLSFWTRIFFSNGKPFCFMDYKRLRYAENLIILITIILVDDQWESDSKKGILFIIDFLNPPGEREWESS
jgi:hypothetical protein